MFEKKYRKNKSSMNETNSLCKKFSFFKEKKKSKYTLGVSTDLY